MQRRRAVAVALAVGVTVAFLYLVVGHRLAYGPVLVHISQQHGVHVSDLPVASLWVAGMVASGFLWRSIPGR